LKIRIVKLVENNDQRKKESITMSNLNNDFLAAITDKNAKSYKAYFRKKNFDVGITAEYTKDVLKDVVQEIIEKTNDVLMFIEDQQTKKRYRTFLEIQ
jgi:hypothetical protein